MAKPEWAKDLLGASVAVDATKGTVTITFDAKSIVAEGPSTDKAGNPTEPTLYFLRTLGRGSVEVPELAVNGIVPVISINGWFPKTTIPKRSGQVLEKVVSAADRLASARKR